jgi:SSS family solute:Na+ symporter
VTLSTVDLVVLVAYIVGVVLLGLVTAGRQRTAEDYFLADRSIPWLAICFSVVATETSALTVVSVPGTAYIGDLWLLQLTIGYIAGRIVVAAFLLPGYFRGRIATAYALLEERFGAGTRRFASLLFMATRALADSVRIFVAAIPLVLITNLDYWQAILVLGAATLAYTYVGGLRSVVWVDVSQMIIYLVGGVAALIVLGHAVPGGWAEIVRAGAAAGKLRAFHLQGGMADASWFWTGLIGGGFLTMASHGADQLIVQRLLAARSLDGARKAVVGSGLVVMAQFGLFLLVGIGLWVYFHGAAFENPDEIFPRFIIERMPPGLAGLLLAAIMAAMMSTVSSSLNSLASAATFDVYAPLTGRSDSRHLLRVGRGFTLLWAVVLLGGAMAFQQALEGTPVVVVALQIASFTYGGLLGGFLVALVIPRADQTGAILAIAAAVLAMSVLWIGQRTGVIPSLVNSLWFACLGSAVALAVGFASTRFRGRPATSDPSGASSFTSST